MVWFMYLKYNIKQKIIVWMYMVIIRDMYISPLNSKFEKMYMWINLKDERV